MKNFLISIVMGVMLLGTFAGVSYYTGYARIGPRAFASNDVEGTCRWLDGQLTQLRREANSQNQLRLQAAQQKLQASLASCQGQKVTWKLPVQAVNPNQVLLYPGYLVSNNRVQLMDGLNQLPQLLSGNLTTLVKIRGVGQRVGPGSADASLTLPVVPGSTNRLLQLQHGSQVVVTAIVERIVVEGSNLLGGTVFCITLREPQFQDF
jgi:hypothetical protein